MGWDGVSQVLLVLWRRLSHKSRSFFFDGPAIAKLCLTEFRPPTKEYLKRGKPIQDHLATFPSFKLALHPPATFKASFGNSPAFATAQPLAPSPCFVLVPLSPSIQPPGSSEADIDSGLGAQPESTRAGFAWFSFEPGPFDLEGVIWRS